MKALLSRRRWRSFASSATTLSSVPRATSSITCRLRPKRLSGCGCFGLEQPRAHALAHAAVRDAERNLEHALQLGEDDRAGRKRACSLEVDLRALRAGDDRKAGEFLDRRHERVFV